MQSDQKIGLSLLIALTGFGLALGFGRRESPAREVIERAELTSAEDAFGRPPVVAEEPQAAPRPVLPPPTRTPVVVSPTNEPVVERRSLTLPGADRRTSEAPIPERPLVPEVTPPTPPPRVRLRSYTIRPGDTLSGIAGRELGDSSRYGEIYEANKARLGSPDAIRVGDAILLPMR